MAPRPRSIHLRRPCPPRASLAGRTSEPDVGRCGKRLYKEWIYVAPDGTEHLCVNLVDCVQLVASQGGSYYRRSQRR